MTEDTFAPAALSPCGRCARAQRTCCQRADVLLTEGDVRRIAAHVDRTDFHEHRQPTDPSYTEDDPEDPEWVDLTVRPDGTRRMLRRRTNGDCTFLGNAGCTLPVEVRPLVCRLYPWDYNAAGLTGSGGEYCPTHMFVADDAATPRAGAPEMTEVLGIGAQEARPWQVLLYEELRHGTP